MRTILLLFTLSISTAFAQEDSLSREKEKIQDFQGIKRNSISLNIGGVTGFAGFTYEYLVSPRWNLEFGGGYIGGGIGTNFYPMQVKNGKPRLHLAFRSFYYNIPWSEELIRHCLSLGLTHFAENGLTFSADVGPCYAHDLNSFKYFDQTTSGFPLYVTWTLKIGYRFSIVAKN
jgi:hypothetical protein